VLTTRQALTGPWAGNLAGWGGTLVPGSLLVVMQELPTGYPNGWFIALSAALQFLLAGVWVALAVSVSRRLTGEVPPAALGIVWLGVGLTRGLTGGAVALAAGLDPEWTHRIAFWCVLSVLWTPLLTYALAQAEEYRRLLNQRALLAIELSKLEARERENAQARTQRVGAAIADALGPALEELRAGLRTASLDAATVDDIRGRLDELSVRARDFTAAREIPSGRPLGRASLVAAMTAFQLDRPVFAGLLTAAATAPVLLLLQYRVGGFPAVAEMAAGIGIATLAFMLVAAGVSRLRAPRLARFVLLRVGTLVGGGLGAASIAFLPWNWLPEDAFVALALVPLLFSAAADILTTGVALEATNARLDALIDRDHELVHSRAESLKLAEEEEAAQLLELVRGELSGRLASCAMALAFLAAGTFSDADRERILGGIVDQLDTAAARVRELRL
jgi:hypothetical protein